MPPARPIHDLAGLLTYRAESRPEDLAFVELAGGDPTGKSLTYGSLARRARRLGGYLARHTAPGDRVLLVFRNQLEFIISFGACLLSGRIAVPVATPTSTRLAARFVRLVETARPALVLATPEIRARAQAVVAGHEATAAVPWPDLPELDDALAGDGPEWAAPDLHGGSIAFCQFTSGSTGNPKGVMVTHANILHNGALLERAFEADASTRLVSWLPFSHDWGLIGAIVFPLYVGIPCAFLDPAAFLYKPAWWLQAISTFRGTMSCAPNFGYEACVERVLEQDCAGLDLADWSVAQIGAEPIQKRTMDRFSERFAPYGFRPEAFHPTYGLAEHTLIVSGLKRRRRPTHLNARRAALEKGLFEECPEGSVRLEALEGEPAERRSGVDLVEAEPRILVGCGLPVAPDLRIVDTETRTTSRDGEVGEVWLSGGSVAGGYWEDPVATRETFAATRADGGNLPHLRTGDLGFLWHDELFLCGRLKDMIIKGGNNHFAEDIEGSVERGHTALRSGCGAAFGVDAAGQERLVVVYELNYGQKPDPPAVIGSIQKAIGRDHNTLADAIVLIQPGTLEKTSSGKVRRREVRRQFLDGELQAIGSWRSW